MTNIRKNLHQKLMRAAMTLFLLVSFAPSWASTFVKDVMLIGGTQAETNALKTTYANQGWTVIDYDLNKGVAGDYIYLLCKYENSNGINFGYVTDLVLMMNTNTDEFTIEGRPTYNLVPCDGGTSFKESKGNLNSGAGGIGLYLYYTKEYWNGNAISSIYFNSNGSTDGNGDKVLENNGYWGSGVSLNAGTSGTEIYLHAIFAAAQIYSVTVTGGDHAMGTPYVPLLSNESTVAASGEAAGNMQFYRINDGAGIGFKLSPDYDAGYIGRDDWCFDGWGRNDAYHTLTSPSTTIAAQWSHADYTVVLSPGANTGVTQRTFYALSHKITTTREAADNCQFYKDGNNIGFKLPTNYNPFSPQSDYALGGWEENRYLVTYHPLSSGTTTFTAYWWTYTSDGTVNSIVCNKGAIKRLVYPKTVNGISVKKITAGIYDFPALETIYYYCDSQYDSNCCGPRLSNCPNLANVLVIDDDKNIYYGRKNTVPSCFGKLATGTSFEGTAISSFYFNNVSEIASSAFQNCTSLEEIEFPSAVNSISSYAFNNCTSLRKVQFTGGVRELCYYSFGHCSALTSLTLKDIAHIEDEFAYSSHLSDLYFEGSESEWNNVTKDHGWNIGLPYDFEVHWRCTVTFNANGHGTAPSPMKAWSNEEMEEPTAPTADGYVFVGWYTDAGGNTEWDGIVSQDMTLYAKWKTWDSLADNASNSSALTTWNNQTHDVKLSGRTLYRDGSWNTLCLPFSLSSLSGTALEGATLKQLNAASSNFANGTLTLSFTDASTIEAGKPYLVKWTPDHYSTSDGRFVINSSQDWDIFAALVNSGQTTLNAVLTNDISVSTMVGTASNRYAGTFDGNGHLLNVYIKGNAMMTAPFSYAKNATIRNLHTSGSVTLTSDRFDTDSRVFHASGLVGACENVTIENCRVSVTIRFPFLTDQPQVHSGGLIGHAFSSPFTIRNSVFDGKISYDGDMLNSTYGSVTGRMTNVGGLVGWDDGSTPNIINCLNAGTFVNPSVISKIARVNGRGTITNCYSTVDATSAGLQNDNRGTYTTATGNALVNLLGSANWEVKDGYVVPKVTTVSVETSETVSLGMDNVVEPEFKGVQIVGAAPEGVTITGGQVTFQGSYDAVPFTAQNRSVLFLGDNNMLYYPGAAMTVGAFRAYFQLHGITAGDASTGGDIKEFMLNFDGDDATGIRPPSISPEGEGTEAFPREPGVGGSQGLDGVSLYDLSGRKLDGKPMQHGIYIKNGKKILF